MFCVKVSNLYSVQIHNITLTHSCYPQSFIHHFHIRTESIHHSIIYILYFILKIYTFQSYLTYKTVIGHSFFHELFLDIILCIYTLLIYPVHKRNFHNYYLVISCLISMSNNFLNCTLFTYIKIFRCIVSTIFKYKHYLLTPKKYFSFYFCVCAREITHIIICLLYNMTDMESFCTKCRYCLSIVIIVRLGVSINGMVVIYYFLASFNITSFTHYHFKRPLYCNDYSAKYSKLAFNLLINDPGGVFVISHSMFRALARMICVSYNSIIVLKLFYLRDVTNEVVSRKRLLIFYIVSLCDKINVDRLILFIYLFISPFGVLSIWTDVLYQHLSDK